MRKNGVWVAVILGLLIFLVMSAAWPGSRQAAVVYSAPTLRGLSEELAEISDVPLDIQVHGSVFAANLIKSGKIPDFFLSVDSELKNGLNYRNEKFIGVYRLVLVCSKQFQGIDALKTAKLGVADPNQAPIGYRALAAMYLISVYENFHLVKDIEDSLNVKFIEENGALVIDAADISPSKRFYMRPNLDFVGSLLEAGVVDCIFAHIPFVIVRDLAKTHNVIELPSYARFDENPPLKIKARLKTGDIDVIRFEAVALSFSELGDRLIALLDLIDAGKYGIYKPVD